MNHQPQTINRPSNAWPSELSENFLVLRKTSFSLLAEDQRAIQHDIEHTAIALDQGGAGTGLLLHGGRQTGGPGQEVSFTAVGDRHLHGNDLLA